MWQSFVAKLRQIAQHCEFGTVLEDLLRGPLGPVCGLRNDRAQGCLLAESKLHLQRHSRYPRHQSKQNRACVCCNRL